MTEVSETWEADPGLGATGLGAPAHHREKVPNDGSGAGGDPSSAWGWEQSPAAQELGRDFTWALGGCPPGCPLAQERSDGAPGQREKESLGAAHGASLVSG